MHIIFKTTTIVLLAALTTSCSKTSFGSGKGSAKKPAPGAIAPAKDKNGANGGDPSADPGAIASQDPSVEPGLASSSVDPATGLPTSLGGGLKVDCQAKNTSILVVDLKSGWWSGDGGAFVQDSLATIKALCKDARIDYHHLLSGDDMEQGYESAHIPFDESGDKVDFASYGEIWLLSGSQGDAADYEVDEPAFQRLLDRIVASKANLYIGAGFGSVTHANALGQKLGLGKLFAPTQEEGDILSFDGRPEVLTSLSPKGHELFAGVKTIADVIRMDGREAASDDIVLASAKTLATDATGHKVIATADVGGRKILLDAGLQRLYAIVVEGTDTGTYLQNVVANLAK